MKADEVQLIEMQMLLVEKQLNEKPKYEALSKGLEFSEPIKVKEYFAAKEKTASVSFAVWFHKECAEVGLNQFTCRIDNFNKRFTPEELYELFITQNNNENRND